MLATRSTSSANLNVDMQEFFFVSQFDSKALLHPRLNGLCSILDSVLIKEGFERILMTYSSIDEKCREWKVNMWLATSAFQKACGFIHHDAT